MLALLPMLLAAAVIAIEIYKYSKTSYYSVTKKSFFLMLSDKGSRGEFLVYKQLRPFEGQDAKLLFNLYIPKKNGKTTEIDALMICRKGIFVIESKNYSGWIFGNEFNRDWYQTLSGGRKHIFYNPIMQNNAHIESLKKLVGESFWIKSVIAFSDRCTFKSVPLFAQSACIVHKKDIGTAIKKFVSDEADALDVYQITMLYNKLLPYAYVDQQTKKEHIEGVQKDQQFYNKDKRESCPRCGKYLVLRNVKSGPNAGKCFLGCTGYPTCKYTKKF